MKKLFAAAAIATSLTALLTAPAQATTVGECHELIAGLRADTAAATSLAPKARAGLEVKADAAATKLDAGKIDDALGKLTDYDSTLDALRGAAKPKVSDADVLVLCGDVDAALACVASIDAP